MISCCCSSRNNWLLLATLALLILPGFELFMWAMVKSWIVWDGHQSIVLGFTYLLYTRIPMYLDPIASVALLIADPAALVTSCQHQETQQLRQSFEKQVLDDPGCRVTWGPISQVAGLISPWCDTHKSNIKDQWLDSDSRCTKLMQISY